LVKYWARWSSPEVLEKRKFSAKSDVWSFGVVLWGLFSYGAIPYFQFSNDQASKKILSMELLELGKEWPKGIHNVCAKSWAKQPDTRPEFKVSLSRSSKSLGNCRNY
jgi:focal adhesion kinase 1